MISKRSQYICAFAFLNILSSLLLGQAFSARLNSLEKNGKWTCTKANVECYLNGAVHFFSGPQALNHYQLNLGAWHGFQEVLYKNPVKAEQINFKFYLPPSSYFYALFNKDESGFSGIRLSTSSLYGNIYFTSRDNGEFIDPTSFQNDHLQPESWNSCQILYSSSSISLYLNGQFVRTFEISIKDKQLIGFRGSAKNVLIDDIAIRSRDGFIVKESFFNLPLFLLCSLIGFLGITILQLSTALTLRFRSRSLTGFWNHMLLFDFRVLILSLIVWFFVPLWDARYPSTTGFLRLAQRKEDAFLKSAPELISQYFMQQHENEKADGLYRICFFGTSQTGGAGAKTKSDMFVNRFEHLLNRSQKGSPRFECLNPSVGGGTIPRMLPYYEKFWIKLKPRMVIVNLSTNDERDTFESDLQQIVDINKKNKIRTIFVLEANSPEFPSEFVALSAKHDIMRRVGRKNDVPVLDAQEYLNAHKDDGILWWDIVHLTSFGHELMADFLYENIKGKT